MPFEASKAVAAELEDFIAVVYSGPRRSAMRLISCGELEEDLGGRRPGQLILEHEERLDLTCLCASQSGDVLAYGGHGER